MLECYVTCLTHFLEVPELIIVQDDLPYLSICSVPQILWYV